MSELVEQIMGPDGRSRFTIYKRSDGLFECSFDRFRVDDLPEYDHHMEYWVTGRKRGIYDTAATAKREAALEFPWVNGNS